MAPAGGPLWLQIWPRLATWSCVRATTIGQRSQRPRPRLRRRARRAARRCLWTRWRGWRTQRTALPSGGGAGDVTRFWKLLSRTLRVGARTAPPRSAICRLRRPVWSSRSTCVREGSSTRAETRRRRAGRSSQPSFPMWTMTIRGCQWLGTAGLRRSCHNYCLSWTLRREAML